MSSKKQTKQGSKTSKFGSLVTAMTNFDVFSVNQASEIANFTVMMSFGRLF